MTTTHHDNKALGLELYDDISRGNVFTMLLVCMSSIMLASFVPTLQPYLLNEVLQIPKSEQGVVSGNLLLLGEITIIASVGVWGALSDRIGRRKVTSAGYFFVAISLILYGISKSIEMLALARFVFSIGVAALSSMIVTISADYVINKSRGKATGYVGFMNGIGAMITALVLTKLPNIYQDQGFDVDGAAFATFATISGVSILIMVIVFLGLHKGHTDHDVVHEKTLKQMLNGFRAVSNPGIALAYGAAFLSRGNLAVMGTFFVLWGSVYGTNELGMTTADALQKAGGVLAISYGASLLAAPFFGILADKISRVNALCVTLFISGCGYTSTFFLSDPFGMPMITALIFIGMAESGCIITSGVLVAEQTPAKIRGAVIGVFSLSGAVGILVASIVGGQLFDKWLYAGPLVFFGLIAFSILIWALLVRGKIARFNENRTDEIEV